VFHAKAQSHTDRRRPFVWLLDADCQRTAGHTAMLRIQPRELRGQIQQLLLAIFWTVFYVEAVI
jgi:hypothetical protein